MQQPTTGPAGIDTPTALDVLASFGYPKAKLAAEVGCSLRSVQRWAAGRHNPSKRNLTSLRALVGQLLMFEHANQDSAAQRARVERLRTAAGALLTAAERAAEDALAERLRAAQAEAELRRQVEQERRDADLAQLRDSIRIATGRKPHRSITHDVDAFALCQPEPEVTF